MTEQKTTLKTTQKARQAPLIQIGVSIEAVAEARRAILDILNCPDMGERTKRKALSVLGTLCRVEATTIQNCTITG